MDEVIERLRNVEIYWSYPILWDNIQSNKYINNNGVYYISKKINTRWGVKERPLYIGETKVSFGERFKQHKNNRSPFLDEKGNLYVRLGVISKPQNLSNYPDYKKLLRNIESALIAEINPLIDNRLCNVSQTECYTLWYHLRIYNFGFRGMIPPEINNREHLAEEFNNK